jgi:hypothetical protein
VNNLADASLKLAAIRKNDSVDEEIVYQACRDIEI